MILDQKHTSSATHLYMDNQSQQFGNSLHVKTSQPAVASTSPSRCVANFPEQAYKPKALSAVDVGPIDVGYRDKARVRLMFTK
jgi:hypothetical protein